MQGRLPARHLNGAVVSPTLWLGSTARTDGQVSSHPSASPSLPLSLLWLRGLGQDCRPGPRWWKPLGPGLFQKCEQPSDSFTSTISPRTGNPSARLQPEGDTAGSGLELLQCSRTCTHGLLAQFSRTFLAVLHLPHPFQLCYILLGLKAPGGSGLRDGVYFVGQAADSGDIWYRSGREMSPRPCL